MGARAKILSASVLCLVVAALVPALIVFACVSVAALTATPQSVQPGGTVTVKGGDYVPGFPVQVHLDTVTGPVLATVASPTGPSAMRSAFTIDVTLPANIGSGQHVLIATQDAHNMSAGIPARAVIYVAAGVPSAPHSTRSAAPVVETGPSIGALALIAVGAAAAGLLILGIVVVLMSGRRSRTGAAGA